MKAALAFFEAGGSLARSADWRCEAEVDALWQALDLRPGARVLEIGCGAGRHLNVLRQRGVVVAGIEASPVLAERARASGLEVECADAASLAPLTGRRFDACFLLSGTLGSGDGEASDAALLALAVSALEPGGRLLVAAPHVAHFAHSDSFCALSCRFVAATELGTTRISYRQRAFHRAELVHLMARAGARALPPVRGPLGQPQTQASHIEVVVVGERGAPALAEDPHATRVEHSWYQQLYQDMGAEYLDYRFTRGTAAEIDFLFERLALRPDDRVLDVACGVGRHSLGLARRGVRAHGVDLSPRMIEVARAQAQQDGLAATFEIGDARDLAPSAAFDAAFCVCEGAFSLLEDDGQNLAVLRAIHGALEPGGRFVLTALNLVRMIRARVAVDWDHAVETWNEPLGTTPAGFVECRNRAYLFPELVTLLRDVGFEIEVPRHNSLFGRALVRPDDMELNLLARKAV